MSDLTHEIYVMASSPYGPCKIGFSRSGNSEVRMTKLQTGHPGKLVVYGVCETSSPHEHEKLIHEYLSRCRIAGEWFDISVLDAERAVDKVLGKRNGDTALDRIRWGVAQELMAPRNPNRE